MSMFELNLGLNSGLTEENNEGFQGDQQYSLVGLASDSEFTGYFNLDQPDEGAMNVLDASLAAKIPPYVETARASLSSPSQVQEADSTRTEVLNPCPVLGCEHEFGCLSDLKSHIQGTHVEFRVCNQCRRQFKTPYALGEHASKTGHASFYCPDEGCGKTFSRFGVFQRHQDTHRDNVRRFPCQHCRNYRGVKGFKRRDHLTQHLRNYHHIGVDDVSGNSRSCPHRDCSEWRPKDTRDDQEAFQKSSDYIAHMRKVHKESRFPCTEPGCNRTGPKGYFRMRDLQKHKLKEHGIPIE